MRLTGMACVVVGGAMAAPSGVLAQEDPLRDLGDPVARVQTQYASIPDEDRAELVLLPVLAGLEARPDDVRLWSTPGAPDWDAVARWIDGESQRALIEAIETIGAYEARYVWCLSYGESSAHTDLAGNPLIPRLLNGTFLAGMDLAYLDVLEDVQWLVHFEALRRASEGDGKGGLDLHASMLRTWRMIADRPMFVEVRTSFDAMITTLELMRDVAYLYADSVSAEDIQELIKELDDRELRIDRIRFPLGDKLAFQQLVRESFFRLGDPDPSAFGPLMAQIATGERALQLFGEADWWVRAIEEHGDYYRTSDAIDAVFGDWEFRWGLDPSDRFHSTLSDYMRLDPGVNAMLLMQLGNGEDLITLRSIVGMELDGTRLSLGCVGYEQRMGDYPDPLFALRPVFVREIDEDPHGADFEDTYSYFVPIRDQERGAREAPTPHEMRVSSDGEIGDQRMQINNMVSIPDPDAYLAEFSSDELKKIEQDLANLIISNPSGTSSPLVISKVSGLYSFLTTPCEVMARQAKLSPEEKEELLDAVREELQAEPNLRVLADKARSRKDLTRNELLNLVKDFEIEFAFRLRLYQNSKRDSSFVEITLGRDAFVLYSVGLDQTDELAREVGLYGSDYLLWPPMISLVRENLDELGVE
ncbi:MAG: hypothetical protein ACF8GE_01175 [Phycisphaerales bacterium JB043]